jgi:Putative threonine efflux protein
MFDYSLLHWTTFFTTAFLLNISPGPDFAFILAQTMRGGRRAGFMAMFGIWTGAYGHVVMAALGLSAILASSAVAFTIVKWVGAAYLVWLGLTALLSKGDIGADTGAGAERAEFRPGSIYRQGVLVALLNPKVGIFFLAFLPQFVVPGAGPASLQLLLHGTLVIAMSALIEPVLVMAGDGLTGLLKRNRGVSRWFERGLGAIFVALGIRLVLLEK